MPPYTPLPVYSINSFREKNIFFKISRSEHLKVFPKFLIHLNWFHRKLFLLQNPISWNSQNGCSFYLKITYNNRKIHSILPLLQIFAYYLWYHGNGCLHKHEHNKSARKCSGMLFFDEQFQPDFWTIPTGFKQDTHMSVQLESHVGDFGVHIQCTTGLIANFLLVFQWQSNNIQLSESCFNFVDLR